MQYLSIEETSKSTNISVKKLKNLIKKSILKVIKIDNENKLILEEVLNYKNKISHNYTPQKIKVLKSEKTKYSIVELFSGCGGLALGFENASFDTKLLVEIEKDCVDTLISNRPNWKPMRVDLRSVPADDYADPG